MWRGAELQKATCSGVPPRCDLIRRKPHLYLWLRSIRVRFVCHGSRGRPAACRPCRLEGSCRYCRTASGVPLPEPTCSRKAATSALGAVSA